MNINVLKCSQVFSHEFTYIQVYSRILTSLLEYSLFTSHIISRINTFIYVFYLYLRIFTFTHVYLRMLVFRFVHFYDDKVTYVLKEYPPNELISNFPTHQAKTQQFYLSEYSIAR